MNVRQLHAYLGFLIAPSVLFFALTGSLQIFSLHEAHGDYRPPMILERLSAVHKDQVLTVHADNPAPKAHAAAKPSATAPDHDDDHEHSSKLSTLLLKWFFVLVALSLVVSTCMGLWIGLTHVRHKRVGWILLLVGAVIPVALLLI